MSLSVYLPHRKCHVAAKITKYGVSAYTYANRTQAYKKAAEVGGVVIRLGRPFYVRVEVA